MPCCIAPAWDNTFSVPTKNLPSSRQEIVPGNSSESPFPIPPKLLHDRCILFFFFDSIPLEYYKAVHPRPLAFISTSLQFFLFASAFSIGSVLTVRECHVINYLSQPVAARHTPVPQGRL